MERAEVECSVELRYMQGLAGWLFQFFFFLSKTSYGRGSSALIGLILLELTGRCGSIGWSSLVR